LYSKQSNESSQKQQTAVGSQQAPETIIDRKSRYYIIAAALLALFLGALDALVMSAAMPTIIADLGGLHLYSWVYSAYLLTRAVVNWRIFSKPKPCLLYRSVFFCLVQFLPVWRKA
jgi:hypothetical protein